MEQSVTAASEVDVAIVGGGMVGSALACLLADSRLRIALIEQHPPAAFAASQPHDLRVSAISPASQQLLQQVGAWSGVLSRRACPYRRMRVWETQGFGDVTFSADQSRQPLLGHIVENRVVQLALWDQLAVQGNITLIAPARIAAIHYGEQASEILLDGGGRVRTRLLVGADGAHSAVRSAAGIGVSARDYRQHALIAYVETEAAQQDITWQRFVPPGPQALLPLTGHHASLVWYERPDQVARLLAADDDSFMAALAIAFPAELGRLVRVLGRARFALRRQHAERYVAPGVALVGDAAHTIHPLAGQGVNLGLQDAKALSQVLIGAEPDGQDVGAIAWLARYQRCRRPANLLMMNSMELLQHGFSRRQPLIKGVRNLGLAVAQHSGPLKTEAMRFAMGLETELEKRLKFGLPQLVG